MFASFRNTVPRQFFRAYSTAPASGNNGNKALWVSLATGAVVVGAYYFASSKKGKICPLSGSSNNESVSKALDSKWFVGCKLLEKTPVNHDTARFRFALESDQELGLDITSCILVKAKIGSSFIPTMRPYTPVSPQDARGYFDLVIKHYPNGKMSSHIHSLAPGDILEINGPMTKYPYKTGALKEVGLIAGGSGITPMFQLIQHVLKDPNDDTKLTLIFANKSEDDIILRSQLDSLAKNHPEQFKLHYIVDKASSNDWKGDTGYVTKELVQKYMPAAGTEGILVGVCGPPPMMDKVSGPKGFGFNQGKIGGILKELGYNSQQVFKF